MMQQAIHFRPVRAYVVVRTLGTLVQCSTVQYSIPTSKKVLNKRVRLQCVHGVCVVSGWTPGYYVLNFLFLFLF